MNFEERALTFECGDASLVSILTTPTSGISRRGVLIVVGGPQYRAGSHRQFTLLARALAEGGIPAMRFDYRGMGDSEGPARTFEDISEDIACAIDHFHSQVPELKDVVIWGLCDAASAALFYAHRDPRVSGLVLLNPWVRTPEGEARAYLKHYYMQRLMEPEFWNKVLHGRFDFAATLRSMRKLFGRALRKGTGTQDAGNEQRTMNKPPLPDRMLDGMKKFKGKVLLIMSGNDLTAQEFSDVTRTSGQWKGLLRSSRVKRFDLPQSNHTFSQREWRDQVAAWTREWTLSW